MNTLVLDQKQHWIGGRKGAYFFCLEFGSITQRKDDVTVSTFRPEVVVILVPSINNVSLCFSFDSSETLRYKIILCLWGYQTATCKLKREFHYTVLFRSVWQDQSITYKYTQVGSDRLLTKNSWEMPIYFISNDWSGQLILTFGLHPRIPVQEQ